MIAESPVDSALLAMSGAFISILSTLKMPSVTGSCSHPTGTGMGATIFRLAITSAMAIIVLIHQAVFLAHSGPTGQIKPRSGP